MNKKTLEKMLVFLILLAHIFSISLVSIAKDVNPVTAVDGNVTVNCAIAETAEKPVMIMVLPQKIDADEETDITALDVNNAKTVELFNALPFEYISAVIADGDGNLVHNFQLDDDVSTGKYSVVINYVGSDLGSYVLGSFEHVGKTDVKNFVKNINECITGAECVTVINEDVYGNEEFSAKEILRKSLANVTYYKTLTEGSRIQTEFCNVFLGYKPVENGVIKDFDINELISAFNKACAFIKLRNDDNTLNVISEYNDKYWDLEYDEGTDFDNLSPSEQAKVLSSVKSGGFTEADILENDFKTNTAVAVFRETETREELEALISETGKYASYFATVRNVLNDANLNGYELQNVYNAALVPEKRSACDNFDDIKKLFKNSLPVKDGGGSGGGSGGTSNRPSGSSVSSSGGIVLPSPSTVDYSTPFVDVKKTDWAYNYIKELYQSKVINGISATEFAPNTFITRQDFIKILLGVLEIKPSQNESTFNDVEKNSYYEGYVTAAVEQGLISGIGNGLFGTGKNILRQDAAVIISRVLTKYNKSVNANGISFNDEADIALYAKEAVAHTCTEEIFSGDDKGDFNPKSNLTRAEACAIICRLTDRLER